MCKKMNIHHHLLVLTILVKTCTLNPSVNEIGLSLRSNAGCKKSEISHSEIIIGRSIIPEIQNGNKTKLLGMVESIQDCIALCCTLHECNLVSFKNGTCHGVLCTDPNACSFLNSTQPEDGAQLSLVIHKSKVLTNQVYVTMYSIMTITCFLVCILGTFLCIVVFYKKSKSWEKYQGFIVKKPPQPIKSEKPPMQENIEMKTEASN